jgi:hypothetical protein
MVQWLRMFMEGDGIPSFWIKQAIERQNEGSLWHL